MVLAETVEHTLDLARDKTGRRARLDKDVVLVRVRIMSKVTSKLQVTVPKSLAQQLGIRPGDDIEWEAAGEVLRISKAKRRRKGNDLKLRLELFDQATQRQERRQSGQGGSKPPASRGWKREDLYARGRAG
jgi:AbrB family looped-hinge helix DNA binding protein